MTTYTRNPNLSRRFKVTAAAMLFSAALLTPGLTGFSTSAYASGNLVAGSKAVISNTDGDSLRIHSGAGVDTSQVAEGHEGDVVSILAGPQYDAKGERWFKVSAPGGTGWIVAGYLDAQSVSSPSSSSASSSSAASLSGGYAIGGKAVIANTDGDTINVRSGAGTDNDQVAQAQEGQVVTILAGPQYDAKGERWFKVSTPDGTGWVVAGYLNPQSSASSSSSSASSSSKSLGSSALAGGYVIGGKASVANTDGDTIRVRSSAGTENDQVAEAQEGQIVTILAGPQYDTKGERWFKVSAPGGTGWIVAGYLDPQSADSSSSTSSGSKSSSGSSTSKTTTITPKLVGFGSVANTDGDPLRIRTSPSTDSGTVTELDPNTSVAIKQGPVTDNQGIVWYQVSAGGVTGWSMGQYLAQAKGPATNSAVSAPAAVPTPKPVVPVATPKPVTQPAAKAQKPVQAAVPTKAPAVSAQASTSNGSAARAVVAPVSNVAAGNAIVSTALKYVGYRYVFGGTTPSGFDCSGFLYYVLNKIGISVGRSMEAEISSGPRVSSTNLQPGDLLFFSNTYKAGLSHAGIYIGNGKFVHAENESAGVAVSDLWSAYWGAHYTAAVRPTP